MPDSNSPQNTRHSKSAPNKLVTTPTSTSLRSHRATSDITDSPNKPMTTPTSTSLASRYRTLPQPWRMVMAALTAVSLLLATNQIFNFGFGIGYVMQDIRYLYLLTGAMLVMVFITFPASHHSSRHVPWYDMLIMLVIVTIFSWYAVNAERIVLEAWEYEAPSMGVWLALPYLGDCAGGRAARRGLAGIYYCGDVLAVSHLCRPHAQCYRGPQYSPQRCRQLSCDG